MDEKLTPQQQMAVSDRGGQLLVSAAAGSGKTKVLVDRLLSFLTDTQQPADIDEFLIITYTKAAAAELRGKIGAKLTEKIAEDPENRHLQQQMQKLYLTKISTVHAYCTDILREYAHRLDIAGDFRVADEIECQELQLSAIEQVLDNAYERAGEMPDFCAFVDTQGLGRDDRQIPDIILKVYNSARCHLNPDAWLDWCISSVSMNAVTDASQTVWGQYLVNDLHSYLDLHIDALSRCAVGALNSEGMEKPAILLQETISQLKAIRESRSWEEIRACGNVDYGRLTFPQKCSDALLSEQIKAVRAACKKGLDKKLRRFADSSEQILKDMEASSAATRGLIELVRQYGSIYERLKRQKRVMDFSDLEHKTLDLLLGKMRTGATAVADEIGSRYCEVMVDEYQDSNAVQDAIFSVLTRRRQNCFMVGDVKQSIYQFRLADPEIFLDKYNTFAPAEEAIPGQGRKVLLSNNFRSAGAVIDAVNDVFSTCMSVNVGGLQYGEEEALYEGIPHAPLDEPEIELYGIQVRQDTYAEEAAVVAERIYNLLDGTHLIRQGDNLRPITPEDIVILLRSPGSVGKEFRCALEDRGIRCTMGGNADLLQTEEVATLRALLEVINNPLQDIPLLAVLTSRVFGFTADELAAIRSKNRRDSIYTALRGYDGEKARNFLDTIAQLRKEARMSNLTSLMEQIFKRTRLDCIYAAMSDGAEKVKNLQTFFQIGASYESNEGCDLGRFVEYLKTLEKRGVIASGEETSAGAVTIMSIHKSKGLEFPVVFLCGLSREFNRESARAQVLCDKELGLGLSCVDTVNRVRYPSIAKHAIAVKMIAESLSEEMRVLYVAMTRAKDRLIMTYASGNLETELSDIAKRMDMSCYQLVTADVDCPGKWILLTALGRTEAGALFALGGSPQNRRFSEPAWLIQVMEANMNPTGAVREKTEWVQMDDSTVKRMKQTLSFTYPHLPATMLPSKQTATQLKGRYKDQEAAEFASDPKARMIHFRQPSFMGDQKQGRVYGTAMHTVMQYIRFSSCESLAAVEDELDRLLSKGYISSEQYKLADCKKIWNFLQTEVGKKLRSETNILREFKFSVLDEGCRYADGVTDEQVLLQGVVDCALIEEDGITVIDFKTDYLTEETLPMLTQCYRSQVSVYAQALSRIYKLPVKEMLIYYFHLEQLTAI